MVISYSNNFIFLRVPKNASSSLAQYFVSKCDKSTDKWTSVNDCGIKENNVPQQIIKKYSQHFRHIHLTLQELIDNDLVSIEDAQSMKKIAVIRHPLHRQLSLFFFLCRNNRQRNDPESFRIMFSEGKHKTDTNNLFTQTQYVKINDQIPDNVEFWKYEDINQKVDTPISSFKSRIRPQQNIDELVKNYYDDATRKAVLDYYAEDIKIYESLS